MSSCIGFESGYQLHITSWENDADNYNTKIISGLTKEDVKFYIYFLKHFRSCSPSRNIDDKSPKYSFGNSDIPDSGENPEKIAIEAAYKKFPPTSKQLLDDVKESIDFWKDDPDESCDWVYDTIGIWGEGSFFRVFDSFEVYLIRTPIPNVTEEFE
jgi:hypothetical protein